MKPMNSLQEKKSKPINSLLAEYAESHKNRHNKIIHYFCVPIIFWSITAMLWVVKIPVIENLAIVATAIISLYYLSKDIKIAIQMLVFIIICLFINYYLESNGFSLLISAIILFIIAWVFQFIGHHIEGKKPSFLKDLQFLLIGPAWIVKQLLG